jgi:NAD(P)-dependent dehydrogenase (short-subunit alcohol dehydrogenase family)
VATASGIQALVDGVGHAGLDTLIYAAGTWEAQGFTPDFDFFATDDSETRRIMAVNLIAPIEITKKLVPCLMQSDNPRALYLGALSAVERSASAQVAYVASKFGLRGAIQALRNALVYTGIGVTAIHPANVATDEVLQDIAEGRFAAQTPIPMADIIATVRWLLSLSPDVDVGDVPLMQRKGRSIVAD